MRNNKVMKQIKACILFLLAVQVLTGCLTPIPMNLKPDQYSSMKKIAIIVTLPNEEMKILDHTNVWNTTYGGYMYGAAGGLIEGLIIAANARLKTRNSLGGDPNDLKGVLKDYDAKSIFYQNFTDRMSKSFKVIDLYSLAQLKDWPVSSKKFDADDYFELCKDEAIDTILHVNFVYGVAVYSGAKSSAAVDGNMAVYDVNTSSLIMKKAITSEMQFRNGNYIDDYLRDQGAVLKSDLQKSINALSLILASHFGVDEDQLKKAEDLRYSLYPIPPSKVNCENPYLLEQDCSRFYGGKRKIEIDGYRVKIAGSSDGRVILVTKNYDAELPETTMFKGFMAMKDQLEKHGLKIIKETIVGNNDGVWGYLIELDGDGYTIIKGYKSKKYISNNY